MGYPKEVIDAAQNELTERQQKAQEKYEQNLMLIRIKEPEIYELEQQVRNTFFKLSLQILGKGGNPQEALRQIEQENRRSQELERRFLKEKGYGEDFLTVHYFCLLCKDTGAVEGKNCKCYTDLLKKYAAKQLNSLLSIKLHSFDELKTDIYPDSVKSKMGNNFLYLKNYAENFSGETTQSMLLIGGTGTGKTLVSSCIAKTLTEHGYVVAFMSAFEMFKRLENENFGRADTDTLATINSCDLLIIDDLGAEFKTNFTEAALYNILNQRINNEKPMLISTNLSIGEIKKMYNERIFSRILGCFTPVKFEGRDIRIDMKMKGSNTNI